MARKTNAKRKLVTGRNAFGVAATVAVAASAVSYRRSDDRSNHVVGKTLSGLKAVPQAVRIRVMR
jgi:hypothetical protein